MERAEQRSRRERQRKERQRQRRWAAVRAALEEALARATGAAAAQASLEVLRDLEAAVEPAQRMLQRASLVAASAGPAGMSGRGGRGEDDMSELVGRANDSLKRLRGEMLLLAEEVVAGAAGTNRTETGDEIAAGGEPSPVVSDDISGEGAHHITAASLGRMAADSGAAATAYDGGGGDGEDTVASSCCTVCRSTLDSVVADGEGPLLGLRTVACAECTWRRTHLCGECTKVVAGSQPQCPMCGTVIVVAL